MTAAASAPLVLLATPVPVILETLRALGPGLAAGGALVTDVGSSKSLVMAAAARVPGLRFVGGHPMSGAEIGRLRGLARVALRRAPVGRGARRGEPPGGRGGGR